MNARKMPSGNWQSKVYVGKEGEKKIFVSVTASSRKDCLLKAAQIKNTHATPSNITVGEAVEQYITAKEGVLSPATVAGYRAKQRNYIEGKKISTVRLDRLDSKKTQEWVSELSAALAKKSVINAYSLLSASVKMFYPQADLSVRFPQGKRYNGYVPSTEEVLLVLQEAKKFDERLYRACILSAFCTLRRGEISPLTAKDICGTTLRIEKDMVKGADGRWVTKLPKTEDSVRDIPLPQWILDEMPKKGPLVDYTPDEITKWFGRLVKQLGVPHFRFHDLRKHAVSLMATKGLSMASIKEIGGWSNMQTPQRIYIKALADAHKREMEQYLGYLDTIPTKL